MTQPSEFETRLLAERPRLVRLCARLSGSALAAEDLAQETLLQAWRSSDRLESLGQLPAWLSAIARNVCLHWSRRFYREQARHARPLPCEPDSAQPIEQIADSLDLEYELERAELATLLDRALALLPAETQALLIHRYVHELPYAELAAQLGVSENTVAVRVHRGKLAIRRVLASELGPEAHSYGLASESSPALETRLWCFQCGQAHLQARREPAPGAVVLYCPHCAPAPDVPQARFSLANTGFAGLLGRLARPSAIVRRANRWSHEYFAAGVGDRQVACTNCGQPCRLEILDQADIAGATKPSRRLFAECAACGEQVSQSFDGFISVLPEVQRFWREQGRIRLLPHQQEAAGGQAVVLRYESLTGSEHLKIVAVPDRFVVLSVERAGGSGRSS